MLFLRVSYYLLFEKIFPRYISYKIRRAFLFGTTFKRNWKQMSFFAMKDPALRPLFVFPGMFPYVCLATMPLFCAETWPRRIQSLFTRSNTDPSPSPNCIYSNNKMDLHKGQTLEKNVKWKHRLVAALLICHCGLQMFLPYSHFITKVSRLHDVKNYFIC